jgi:hypothetical protein
MLLLGSLGILVGLMWFVVQIPREIGHLGRAQKAATSGLTPQNARLRRREVQRSLPLVERLLPLIVAPLGLAGVVLAIRVRSAFPAALLAPQLFLMWRSTWRTRQLWERLPSGDADPAEGS